MKKTVVAFDFGASSGRAIAGTYQDGRLEYKEVHRFDNIPVDDDGRMCHNFPAICKEVDAALSKINSADGLSFDTWGVDYGLLDKSGNLLRLPCHYRDTRTAGTVEKVLKKIPADNLYRATGNQIMEINTLFQLTTEDTAGAEKLLFMPDLFAHHLCGSMQTEPTIASTSQLLDPVNQIWRTDIAKACGIDPQLLPAVGPSATVLGKTDGGIQVIATAGHDTQCAVAAMPAAAGEQPAFLSCGTWSLIGCELDEPILTPESRADDLSNEQGANGKTNYLKNISGLWLIQETRRAYRRAGAKYSYNDLEQLARAAEPFTCFIDPDDPRFGVPGNLPRRVQEFCAETNQYVPQTRGEIMRCIYESLAMKYRYTFCGLRDVTGQAYGAIHMIGGGTKDRLLCQMTADSCSIPVVAGPIEATAMGNIAVQLMALGVFADLKAVRRAVAQSEDPKHYAPQNTAAYDAAYDRFVRIVK